MEHDSGEKSLDEISHIISGTLPRYLESALIITLITASLYFIGDIYYESFFDRLSVPTKGLVLPSVFYLKEAIYLSIFTIPWFFFSFYDAERSPNSFFQALRGNIIAIAYYIIILIWQLRRIDDWNDINLQSPILSMLLQSILMLGIIIVESNKRKSLAHYIYRAGWGIRLLSLVGFIFFISSLAALFGDIHAAMLIEGTLPNSYEITLELKDTNINIDNSSLILVMHTDSKYYVVERRNPAPKYPCLYIIPDDQVKKVTIHKIPGI